MRTLLGIFLLLVVVGMPLGLAADDEEGICAIEQPCEVQTESEETAHPIESGKGLIPLYYFYGLNCPHCAKIEPLLEELAARYPEVAFHSFEVYYDKDNQELFKDFVARFGLEKTAVPLVFIGEEAFLGERAIRGGLEEAIQYYLNDEPIDARTVNKAGAEVALLRTELTIPVVIVAALADSINPCAFAVLIFLLTYLLALGARRRMLRVGLTYIAVVFIVYFLSGLGIFTAVQTAGLTRLVFNLAAGVAIFAGLINVKDFFWYGRGFTLAIPESKKPLLEKYIHKASIPAAVVLGFLVSMFELPCTGGVYFAILGML
ncbi:MAG: hypothetical protein ACE5LQ_04555, partial [Candidatus Bipolaricaulia bacterium]